jgi:protein-S-isoprenylcysteine O-methyltransferase Ste14
MFIKSLLNLSPISLVINLVVVICVFSVLMAVIFDFVEFHNRVILKKHKKSWVETGTMFIFYLIYYLILRNQFGHLNLSLTIAIISVFSGLFLLIFGAIFNIRGRFDLGKNWANQIEIYTDHKFISRGTYSLVRHPLYASLIWMFIGGALVYVNYMAISVTIFIFLPMMYYRASQEESLLLKEYKEYNNYRKKVGMFFPKIL